MNLNRPNSRIIFFHVLFWIVYWSINTYLWNTFDRSYNATTIYGLTRLPVKILAVYINLLLLRQYFFKKQYAAFFPLFLLNLVVAGLVQTIVSSRGVFDYESFTQFSLPVYSAVMVSGVLIIIHQFLVRERESKQMEIEKIKTELSLLKGQMQPHFLFNTLNNIYALTIDNSHLAGKSILQLSGLLRYVLYESETELVDLQKEISYLKDYIELERIRFASRIELSFNISGDIEDKIIVPMLLIPFLENAFKHASNKLNEKIWITIDLIVKERNLSFTVENSVFQQGKTKLHNVSSGIGLENVKKRLALLYKNYILNNELKENYYHMHLKIPLG